jgi:hypothetical protein
MDPVSLGRKNSSSSGGRNKASQASADVGKEREDKKSGANAVKSENHAAIDNQKRPADRVRRSAYGPEFLKEFAGNGLPDKDGPSKFKVITGSEAATFYEDFVG